MTRRLATLATLARLDDRRMQAAAAELVPLQDRIARLDAEAQELDRRRLAESAITQVEAMPYLGRFLATLKREMDRIAADRAGSLQAAEAKREQLLDAWRDLRAKEVLRDALLDRARHELEQAEQDAADEQGLLRAGVSRRPAVPE